MATLAFSGAAAFVDEECRGNNKIVGSLTKDIIGYGEEEKSHYYLIASPIRDEVNPENCGLGNTFDLYSFDQGEDKEWRNYKEAAFNFVCGKGYLYASDVETRLIFNGVPYDGDGTITLDKVDNTEFSGWNLVGNPFPYNAYIDRDCYYKLNENGSEIIAESSETPIEAMEGIFVIADNDGETLTFFSESSSRGGNFALNLKRNNLVVDRAIVCFGDSRQLPKLQLRKNSTKLFIPQDNGDFSVVRGDATAQLPVSFKAAADGSYTLSLSSMEVEFSYLHLTDLLTGKDIDLLATPSYTFDARTTDDASRFRLLMAGSNAQRAIFRESGAESVHPLLPTRGKETHQRAAIEDVLTFAPEGFATYYDGEKDLVLPTGMKARIVTAAGTTDDDGNTQLTYETIADGDAETKTVPHATAVLLQVEPAIEEQTIAIALANPTTTAITQTNLLHGSDEAINTYGNDGDTRFYKLSYSADGSGDFGWYWGAGGGAAFQSGAHKAWLALPAAASSRFLSLPGYDGDTTSVNEELRVKNEESGSAVWYTVDGRRLNGKPTAKGVYIHQGKKAVIE